MLTMVGLVALVILGNCVLLLSCSSSSSSKFICSAICNYILLAIASTKLCELVGGRRCFQNQRSIQANVSVTWSVILSDVLEHLAYIKKSSWVISFILFRFYLTNSTNLQIVRRQCCLMHIPFDVKFEVLEHWPCVR